jgi:hypothetical protein
MIFINILTLVFLTLISFAFFKIKKLVKRNNYRFKVCFVYCRTAKNAPEFVVNLSLGILAGAIFALITTTNIIVGIISFISIIIAARSAIKANYVLQKVRK